MPSPPSPAPVGLGGGREGGRGVGLPRHPSPRGPALPPPGSLDSSPDLDQEWPQVLGGEGGGGAHRPLPQEAQSREGRTQSQQAGGVGRRWWDSRDQGEEAGGGSVSRVVGGPGSLQEVIWKQKANEAGRELDRHPGAEEGPPEPRSAAPAPHPSPPGPLTVPVFLVWGGRGTIHSLARSLSRSTNLYYKCSCGQGASVLRSWGERALRVRGQRLPGQWGLDKWDEVTVGSGRGLIGAWQPP